MNQILTLDLPQLCTKSKYILVDIFATWCKPCDRMTPVLTELDGEFDHISFCMVNADTESDYMALHSVTSIPTLLLYDESGMVCARWEGNQDIGDIRYWLQTNAPVS